MKWRRRDAPCAGRRLAVVLALVLASRELLAHAERAEPEVQAYVIIGIVDMPDGGSSSGLPLVPVELDPRFVIRVRIDKILRGTTPWKQGSTLRFGIHSPARMFGRSKIRHERFRFTFAVKPGDAPEWGCKYCVTAVESDDPANGSSGPPDTPP